MRTIAEWFVRRSSTSTKSSHLVFSSFTPIGQLHFQVSINHQWATGGYFYDLLFIDHLTSDGLAVGIEIVRQSTRWTLTHLLYYFVSRSSLSIDPGSVIGIENFRKAVKTSFGMNA